MMLDILALHALAPTSSPARSMTNKMPTIPWAIGVSSWRHCLRIMFKAYLLTFYSKFTIICSYPSTFAPMPVPFAAPPLPLLFAKPPLPPTDSWTSSFTAPTSWDKRTWGPAVFTKDIRQIHSPTPPESESDNTREGEPFGATKRWCGDTP